MPSFFKRKPKVEGLIGYYRLGDWWLEVFSEDERRRIAKVYEPGGLTDGGIASTTQPAADYLWALASWFKNPKDLNIARRILAKAEELALKNSASDPLALHFAYQQMVQIFYRSRDEDSTALEDAIQACEKQIALAPKSAKQFIKENPDEKKRLQQFGAKLPAHVGYEQLCIIREKEKNYTEAIRLAKQAQEQGWNGDWEKRIARCEAKLAKEKR